MNRGGQRWRSTIDGTPSASKIFAPARRYAEHLLEHRCRFAARHDVDAPARDERTHEVPVDAC